MTQTKSNSNNRLAREDVGFISVGQEPSGITLLRGFVIGFDGGVVYEFEA